MATRMFHVFLAVSDLKRSIEFYTKAFECDNIKEQYARLAGACPVIVTDLDDARLEAARKMGVDVAINTKTDPDGLENAVKALGRNGLPVMNTRLSAYQNSDVWTSDEDIKVFLNMIKYGKLDITPLISHEFAYTEIPEA